VGYNARTPHHATAPLASMAPPPLTLTVDALTSAAAKTVALVVAVAGVAARVQIVAGGGAAA